MMIYLENGEWVDDDNLSFSGNSYDAEEERSRTRTNKSAYIMKRKIQGNPSLVTYNFVCL
jgi:hypothetical protein